MAVSNSKEWYEKSEIDYFSAFLKLWLAFNAFYKRLYQVNRSLRNDRQFIEEIKNTNNIVREKFQEYFITSESSEAVEFRFYLSVFETIKIKASLTFILQKRLRYSYFDIAWL